MAVEAARGCGYRKVGGLYIVGGFEGVPCCRLPVVLDICPTCGQGVKFSRGIQWVAPELVFKGFPECVTSLPTYLASDLAKVSCPLAFPKDKMALMWVGEKFYTPDTFSKEALEMGVSKRISAFPKGFVLGKTRVLLAHKNAVKAGEDEMGRPVYKPGVFMSFVPQRLERIVTVTMNAVVQALLACEADLKLGNKAAAPQPTKEELVVLAAQYLTDEGQAAAEKVVAEFYWVYEDVKRGITLVVVPDDDPDHLQAERKKRSVPKRAQREESEEEQVEKYAALDEFE